MTREELLDIMRDRHDSYVFLSRCYREEVSAPLLDQLLDGMAGAGEGAGAGYALLAKFARDHQDADREALLIDLAAEYARLFLNAGDPPHVYPYESVYTSKERLLMQEAYDQVRAVYRQEGLAREASFTEPDDHVAIEMEFMAHLCGRGQAALAAGDLAGCLADLRKQQDFLAGHLLAWVPQFVHEVEAAARLDFYRAVALLTGELLANEAGDVAELAAACAGAETVA